tara:strand:+ start:6085 stop:6801 length:717 start_codon:yes stop_codon:yes gene_type:complete
MFNENKIWHSVEARKQYKRKEQQKKGYRKRRRQLEAKLLRLEEKRPSFKKTKFRVERHDSRAFQRIERAMGTEKAQQYFYSNSTNNKNEFWWEANFDHSRYITKRGELILQQIKEKKEQATRDALQDLLNRVPKEQHKRLKEWLDHCDYLNEYHDLFDNEDGINIHEFLDEIAYEDVDWAQILPIKIINSILFHAKQWNPNTIPVVPRTIDEDTCPDSNENIEIESDWDSEEEFTAGF